MTTLEKLRELSNDPVGGMATPKAWVGRSDARKLLALTEALDKYEAMVHACRRGERERLVLFDARRALDGEPPLHPGILEESKP